MLGRVFAYCACIAALMTFGLLGQANAQETVKIGAIYPLSGNAASAGNFSKAAIELAVDIVNNAHPELKDIPLAEDQGLPGLKGAKISVVFADNQRPVRGSRGDYRVTMRHGVSTIRRGRRHTLGIIFHDAR